MTVTMLSPLASAAARVDEFTRTSVTFVHRLPGMWFGGSGDRVLGVEVAEFLESALAMMVENRRQIAEPTPEPQPEPAFEPLYTPMPERRTVFKLWLPGRSKADPIRIAQLERELGLSPQPAPRTVSRQAAPVRELSLWAAMHEMRRRAGCDAWSVASEVLHAVVSSQCESGEGWYEPWAENPARTFGEVRALIALAAEFACQFGPQLGGER